MKSMTSRSHLVRMRHGTQGHMAEPREPTRCLGVADSVDAWQGHASPLGRPGGATWQCERAGK